MDLTTAVIEAFIGVGVGGVAYALFAINTKIKDLWEWHNKEDDEGVKIWYTRNKTMEETLEKMAEIVDRMDRREERSMLIQNETIKVMQDHTVALGKLIAVVEALTLITKKNGK